MNKPTSNKNFPHCGEIWIVKFEKLKESRKPFRPCLIISSDEQNEFDEKVVVAPLTTDDLENIKLVEVFIDNIPKTGLDEPSKVQLNYPFTVDKKLRLLEHLGIVNLEIMTKVNVTWENCFWLKKI